ncbi:apoptosis regulator BAX [Biomphalaria pfeifferi]|uniref:Apoptosis regulator BAX n=1 Tax=Biomphalaria pfeifferi TaxID=112525 RepID=A0AAD8FIN9_BIOPF|nr:apoptosis regulator BAX [Biomphalaria pfeifferi]
MGSIDQSTNVTQFKDRGVRIITSRQTKELLSTLVAYRIGKKTSTQMSLAPETFAFLLELFSEATDMVEKSSATQYIGMFPREGKDESLREIVRNIVPDGEINFGRVLVIFSLAYQMCVQFPDDEDYIIEIMETLVDEFLVDWIVDNGGWEKLIMSCQAKNVTFPKTKLACCIAALAVGGLLVYKKVL